MASRDLSARAVRLKNARRLLLSGLAVDNCGKRFSGSSEAGLFTSAGANKAEACAVLFAEILKRKVPLAHTQTRRELGRDTVA